MFLTFPSEPTDYDFEWPRLSDGAKQKSVRLDYVLVSKAVLDAAGGSLFAGTIFNVFVSCD